MRDTAKMIDRLELQQRSTEFARWAMALAQGDGFPATAADFFERRWPKSTALADIRKTTIPAGNSTASGWAGPLAPMQHYAEGFAALVRARSVMGRLAGLRRAPVNVSFPAVSGGVSVYWTGQGRPTPLSAMALELVRMVPTKVTGIAVTSKELVTSADPSAESVLRGDLESAAVAMLDSQFLDPTIAAVADVSPASITYGATEVQSSGSTAANVRADLLDLIAAVGETELIAPAFVMSPRVGAWLGSLTLANGGLAFPDVGAMGGTLMGIPVLTSNSAPRPPSSGSPTEPLWSITLIDAVKVTATDGTPAIGLSSQAAVQMDDAPTNSADTPTSTVSLWQLGLIGFRLVWPAHWKRTADDAVAILTDLDIR